MAGGEAIDALVFFYHGNHALGANPMILRMADRNLVFKDRFLYIGIGYTDTKMAALFKYL